MGNTLKYQYRYDGMSRLSELIDLSLNRSTRYEYDILGRLTAEKHVNNNLNSVLSRLDIRYDDTKNRIAGYDVAIGSNTQTVDYVYNINDTLRPRYDIRRKT